MVSRYRQDSNSSGSFLRLFGLAAGLLAAHSLPGKITRRYILAKGKLSTFLSYNDLPFN